MSKTYNTGYSPDVTDLGTNPALTGLTRVERMGCRVFQWVWSYVPISCNGSDLKGSHQGPWSVTEPFSDS
jgi:hypothetical protein